MQWDLAATHSVRPNVLAIAAAFLLAASIGLKASGAVTMASEHDAVVHT